MEKLHSEAINAKKRHLLAQFEIPELPKTYNSFNSTHWMVRKKEADRWTLLVKRQCVLKKIIGLKLQRCELEFTRFSSQEPDFDGLVSSFKFVTDALVDCEVMLDDKPSIIGSPVYFWEKAKQGEGKIRVKVWSVG